MLNKKIILTAVAIPFGLIMAFTLLSNPVGSSAQIATTTAPLISSVAATSTASTSASVTWTTDQPATSHVFYGPTMFYGASTTHDMTLMTSHAQTLLGLTPDTQYHFYVHSMNASGTEATSSDMTFRTLAGTTTATTSPPAATTTAPVISDISATTTTTSATISWETDQPTRTYVAYGLTSSFTASTSLTTSLFNFHSLTLTGLTPNTMYHYQIFAENASGTQVTSSHRTFTTTSAVSTTTSTTTDTIDQLQDQIDDLLSRVQTLESKVAALEAKIADLLNGDGTGSNGTTTPSSGASIHPTSISLSPGAHIDFNGRNFGGEEDVNVTQGGTLVTIAHADGGGNFTTGSLSVPTSTGTYTYTFIGQRSGTTLTSTVTVE